MAPEINFAADARQALNHRDYAEAVRLTRIGLTSYLARPVPGSRTMPAYFLRDTYGLLAAAFNADDIFDLMEKSAERILEAEPELGLGIWDETIARYREDMAAMRWLCQQVEAAGSIALKELDSRAFDAGITAVKSRLSFMHKAGTVHHAAEYVNIGRAPATRERDRLTSGVPRYVDDQTVGELGTSQNRFYLEFRDRFHAGHRVELDQEWSYGFRLMRELAREGRSDLGRFRKELGSIERAYPNSPLERWAVHWLADSYFLEEDFEAGYEVFSQRGGVPLDVYVNLAGVLQERRLTSSVVSGWLLEKMKVTDLLVDRRAEIDHVFQELLNAAHSEHGQSTVMELWDRLVIEREQGAPGPAMEVQFGAFLSQKKLNELLEVWDKGIYEAVPRAFDGLGEAGQPINWPIPFRNTYWFHLIVRARLQALYREAENIVRRNHKLPAVGEGWFSEVMLLRAVRDAFPDRRVVHQGRPQWLGQQSLDIFFPDENIAIEYQGVQHSAPVSRFGGGPAFARQLERDSRKRDLCSNHGCYLIEVHPGYLLEDVIAEVESALPVQLKVAGAT